MICGSSSALDHFGKLEHVNTALAVAHDQVLQLQALGSLSCFYKRKCLELVTSANYSLGCLARAQRAAFVNPAQVLDGAKRLTHAARHACKILRPCAAARESQWHHVLTALRRHALWQLISVAQHEIESSLDPELHQQLLLPCMGASAASRSCVFAGVPSCGTGSSIQRDESAYTALTNCQQALVPACHQRVDGRKSCGEDCTPAMTRGSSPCCGGSPYARPTCLAPPMCGPSTALVTFPSGALRPSGGRAAVERLWFVPSGFARLHEGNLEQLLAPTCHQPETAGCCDDSARIHSITAWSQAVEGDSGAAPAMLMAVLGNPSLQAKRSHASGPLASPRGRPGGVGSLLAYSSIGGCENCLPFSTAAEHISAAAVDRSSRTLYTGHGDGSIMACSHARPGMPPETFACTNAAVTAVCVEATGKLWIGDRKGRIISYQVDPFAAEVLQPFEEAGGGSTGAGYDVRADMEAFGCGGGLACGLRSADRGKAGAMGGQQAVVAISSYQGFVMGSSDRGCLCLISSSDRRVRAVTTNTAYGHITALAVLPWPAGDAGAQANAHGTASAVQQGALPDIKAPATAGSGAAGREPETAGYAGANGATAAPCTGSFTAASQDASSMHGILQEEQQRRCGKQDWHEQEATEQEVAAHAGSGLAAAGRRDDHDRSQLQWRLLTGTSRGAVLLWDASHGQLQLLCVVVAIPAAPKASSAHLLRSLYVYPDLGLLVAARASGQLAIAKLPTHLDVPKPPRLPASSTKQATEGGKVVSACTTAPALDLPCARFRAHKGRLTAVDACGLRLATGSAAGGIKVWDVLELRSRAVQQGVQLPGLPPHLAAVDAWWAASKVAVVTRHFANESLADSVRDMESAGGAPVVPASTSGTQPAAACPEGSPAASPEGPGAALPLQRQADLQSTQMEPQAANLPVELAAGSGAAVAPPTDPLCIAAVAPASEAAASPFALIAASVALGGSGDAGVGDLRPAAHVPNAAPAQLPGLQEEPRTALDDHGSVIFHSITPSSSRPAPMSVAPTTATVAPASRSHSQSQGVVCIPMAPPAAGDNHRPAASSIAPPQSPYYHTTPLPSGSVYTASRTAGHNGAPSAGSGAAGAAHRSGAANASSDPGACTASLTPAAPMGHTILERSSTGIYNSSMAGASHCSPMPPPAIFCHSSAGWDGYGIYGTPYSSYEQVHMSVMSGPGSALARNPTSTFIRRSELQFIQEIGCGAEGRVWRARWQHIDVAVKEMFPKASTLAKLTGAFRDVNQGRQCNEGSSPDSGPGPVPRTATGVSCSGPIPVQRSLQFGPSRPPPGPTNPTLCGGIAPAAGSDLLRTRSQTHVPPATGAGVASSPSGVTPPATILGPCTSTTPTRPRNTANQVFWTPAAKGPTSGGGWGGPGEAAVLPEFTSLRSTAPLGSYLGSGAADVAAVIKEARAMAQLSQHPNIVRFIGICLEQPLIVTEYYPRGSLFDLLRKAADGDREACLTLHWNNRLCMLHDLAAGMSYLHSQGYLHGDLRSPNVFVAQQDRVKIGDFGYAKLLGDSGRGSASTSNSANPRWMAPEALKVGRVTLSADVFSFGVVMWELLTWQIPYDELNPFQVIVSLVHDPNFRPAVPPREQLPHLPPYADLNGYLALMQQCWHCDPAARPKFDQVADRLDALKAASLGVMHRWRRSSEAGPGPRASALFRSASTASHVPAGNVPPVTDGTVAGVFPAAAAAAGGMGSSGGGAPMGQGPTPAGCPAAAHRRAASGSVVPQHPSTLPTQRSVAERPTSGGGAQGGRSGARGPSLLGPGGSSGGNANTTGLRPGSGQVLAVTPSGDATLQSLPYPRLGGGGGGSDGGARPPRCNDAGAASSPAAQAAPAPLNVAMAPKPLKHGNSGALSYAVAHVQPVAPPPRARQRLWGPMDSGGGLRPSMPQAQQGEGSSAEVDTAAGRPPAQTEDVVDSTGSTAPLLGGGLTKAAGMTVSDPGSVPEPPGRHSSALAPLKCDFQQQVTSEGGALRSVQSTDLLHQLQSRTSSLASNAPHAFSRVSLGADATGGMRRVTGTTFAPLGHVESMNTTGSGSEGLASPFADLTLLSGLQ